MWSMFSLLTDATLINMELVSKYSSLRTINMYLSYITTNDKKEVCCVSFRQQHTRVIPCAGPANERWRYLVPVTPSLTVPARTQNDPYTQ